jgi:hypothetical protein
LSVDAFHDSGIAATVTLPMLRAVGAVGATVSRAGAGVDGGVGTAGGDGPAGAAGDKGVAAAHGAVQTRMCDRPERRPRAPTARTVRRCRVAHVSPEIVKRGTCGVPARCPSMYTWKLRARARDETRQNSEMLVSETSAARSLDGRGVRAANDVAGNITGIARSTAIVGASLGISASSGAVGVFRHYGREVCECKVSAWSRS